MYAVSKKEILALARPGKAPRQAPRFPTIILGALEDYVVSQETPMFWRVLSWWLLIQCWGTLRFDYHRGLLPSDFKVSESGLLAKLTRSKVSVPDKYLNFRIVVIHSSVFAQHKQWLSTSWELLLKGAPYERHYLLPAPSNNYRGFKKKELKYPTAFAIQTQIISLASYRGLRVFQLSTRHYYTPHSGRNLMPSATAVLGFSKSDRDILGGWSAEGSERYSRAAKHKIATMQESVATTFKNPEPDPLGEADDIDALGEFLKTWDVPEKEVLRSKKILTSRTFSDVERRDPSGAPSGDVELVPGEILVDDEIDVEQQSWNRGRTELLGYGSQADQSCNWLGTGAWILYFEFQKEGDQGITPFGPMLHVTGS